MTPPLLTAPRVFVPPAKFMMPLPPLVTGPSVMVPPVSVKSTRPLLSTVPRSWLPLSKVALPGAPTVKSFPLLRLPLLATDSVPPFTVVNPVYVFTPVSAKVPVVVLFRVRPPDPATTALTVAVPATFTLMALLDASVSAFVPPVPPVIVKPSELNVSVWTVIALPNCTIPPVPVKIAVSVPVPGNAASDGLDPSHQLEFDAFHVPDPPRPAPLEELLPIAVPSASQ